MTGPARAAVAGVAVLVGLIGSVPPVPPSAADEGHPRVATSAAESGPGQVLGTSRAGKASRLAGARHAFVLRYTTTSIRGRTVPASGLVLVPEGPAPEDGWPVVVYGHMTTGGADSCAPTRVRRGHPERRRMQQGDDGARALLAEGVVVLRPDYEGLGVRGAHPYLRGGSLGTAMVDMMAAARRLLPVEGRWVAAGHSEGAVAALNVADRRRRLVPGMRLVGVSTFTPVTRMEVLVRLLQGDPVAFQPLTGELLGLAGLLLKGVAVDDPAFRRLLLRRGGLSPEARALWGDLENRCLEELAAADSWGGLAPADVLGPRGEEAAAQLRGSLAAEDVRLLKLRDVPVRIDEGLYDAVAPAVFTEELVRTYRERGVDVTHGRWASDHSSTNSAGHAVPEAVAWMVRLLRN